MFDYKIHITPDDYIHELEEKDCKDYLFIAPVGETLNNEMSDVYYQENAFVPYHEHSKGYETFSIDRGSVEVTINGKRSVAEAGDLIHIEPYMSHGPYGANCSWAWTCTGESWKNSSLTGVILKNLRMMHSWQGTA